VKQPLLHSCMGPYVETPEEAGLEAAKSLSRKTLRKLLDAQEERGSLGSSGTATGSPTDECDC